MSRLVPLEPLRCLCEDCLRETVAVFDSNGEAECTHCGGELCYCGDCIDTLNLLRAGERSPAALGLLPGVVINAWTPSGGVA